MTAEAAPASNELQAGAFKQLYPEQYYAKFINSNLRPDGRSLDGARATTIGINPIGTADSSALVKMGETTAMAGIKLGVCLNSPFGLGCCHRLSFSGCTVWRRCPNAIVYLQADNVMLILLSNARTDLCSR